VLPDPSLHAVDKATEAEEPQGWTEPLATTWPCILRKFKSREVR
jgi:hypothetical protein